MMMPTTSFGSDLFGAGDSASRGRHASNRDVILSQSGPDIRLSVAKESHMLAVVLQNGSEVGAFATTVDFYRYREPYPPEFFQKLAGQIKLTRQSRMLDVACGPGNLAIGFARFVGSCTAIDVEPEMLDAARQAAAQAAVNVEFRQVPIQKFDRESGAYDLVTVGRALHWLPREETLAVFDRIVAPDGHIAICASTAAEGQADDWVAAYKRVRKTWASDPDESRYKIDLDQWFAPSRFRRAEDIAVEHRHRISIDELILRALSFSTTSPAVVGDQRPQFEAELRAALEPFAGRGDIEERLTVKATIFR
jgi:SAM-dependent methyltransferase